MAITTTPATSIFVDGGPGATQPLDLSILYVKQLKVRLSKHIGMVNAKIENIESINAGTAIYFLNRRNFTKNYDGTQGPDAVKLFQINVQLDQRKIITYTIEQLDLLQSGAKFEEGKTTLAQSFVAGWTDARAKSTEAYLYAKFTSGLVKAASENSYSKINLIAYQDANKTQPESDVAKLRAQVYIPVRFALNELQAQVSSSVIGLDTEEYLLMASPNLHTFMLLATSTIGGDASRKALIDNELDEVGGVRMIVNPYLGSSYNTNDLDQNETFNFSAVDGILIYRDAYAFPYNNGVVTTTIQPNTGNLNFIHKFVVNKDGGAPLRPSTFRYFQLTGPASKK